MKRGAWGQIIIALVFAVFGTAALAEESTYMDPTPVANLTNKRALDFALEVGGVEQRDDWNFDATVTATGTDTFTFVTSTGEQGRLAYRIPGNLEIPVAAGEQLKIERTMRRGLGERFKIAIRRGGELVAAAGYDDGMEPRETVIPARPKISKQKGETRLWLSQDAEADVVPREYHGAKFYDLPVKLAVLSDDQVTATYEVPRGQVTRLEYESGKSVSVLVKDSQHFDDSGADLSLELYPYTFSYVVIGY